MIKINKKIEKVMDTKEAIEFLEEEQYIFDDEEEKYNEIIALLQQGEKYREMWEEHFANCGEYTTSLMKDIEQKYFPKKGKSN